MPNGLKWVNPHEANDIHPGREGFRLIWTFMEANKCEFIRCQSCQSLKATWQCLHVIVMALVSKMTKWPLLLRLELDLGLCNVQRLLWKKDDQLIARSCHLCNPILCKPNPTTGICNSSILTHLCALLRHKKNWKATSRGPRGVS